MGDGAAEGHTPRPPGNTRGAAEGPSRCNSAEEGSHPYVNPEGSVSESSAFRS